MSIMVNLLWILKSIKWDYDLRKIAYEMFVEVPIRLRYLIFDRLCCGFIVAWYEFVFDKVEQVTLVRQVLLWFSVIKAKSRRHAHFAWNHNKYVNVILSNRHLSRGDNVHHSKSKQAYCYDFEQMHYLPSHRCMLHEITTSMLM